jgi:hypothetical protein
VAIDYTALHTEIVTDPKGLGYAAHTANNDDAGVAILINALTGNGIGTVYLTVSMTQLLEVLTTTADFDALMVAGVVYNTVATLTMLGPMNFAMAAFQSELTHLATEASLSTASKTAWTNAVSRNGSRAEVLFGTNTVVLHTDVAIAMGR